MKTLNFVCLNFFFVHFSFGQKINDLGKITKKDSNNIYMTKIVCNEIKLKAREEQKFSEFNTKIKDLSEKTKEEQKAIFDKITKSAEERMFEHKLTAGILELNGEIIKISTDLVPVFGKVVDKSIDKFNDYILDESMKQVKADLETKLVAYSKKHTKQEVNALKNTQDPEKFLEVLDKGLAPLEKDLLSGVPDEEKDIVLGFYQKQATAILKAGIQKLKIDQTKTETQIENEFKEIKSNIKGLSRAIATEFQRTQNAMGEIVDTQNQILTDINGIKTDIGKFKEETVRNFEFVHEFMYSRMTTSERLTAVKNGMIGKNWTKEQYETEQKKLKILEKQQKIQEKADQILNYGSNVIALASTLGVNPKITQTATKVVAVGSALNNAFKAFSSGNYLSMAGAVASLFGLGGPDVEQERHDEIMGKFKEVLEQLGVMDKKLDHIIKTQELILQNQQKIYESIIELSKQVSNNHVEVMDELRKIHGDILVNRSLIIAEPMSQYSSCENILPVLQQPSEPSIIDTRTGKLPNFDRFDSFWLNKKDNIESCKQRYITVFEIQSGSGGPSNEFSSLFRAETHRKKDEKAFEILLENYAKLLELLEEDNEFKTNFLQNNLSIFRPTENINSFNTKVNKITLNNTFSNNSEHLKKYLLEPNIISLHSNYLLNFHTFYMMLNPKDGGNPYSYEEFLKTKIVITAGKEKLKECLQLVNHAIAQQTLLSGDIILPIISEIFRKKQSGDPSIEVKYNIALKLMNQNSILAQNFILYKIRKELIEKGDKEFKAYTIPYNEAKKFGEFKGLKLLTVFPWEFSFQKERIMKDGVEIQPQGVSIKLGDRFYKLPEYISLQESNFVYTSDFYNLVNIRERILEEISTYDVYKSFESTKEREAFNYILVEN